MKRIEITINRNNVFHSDQKGKKLTKRKKRKKRKKTAKRESLLHRSQTKEKERPRVCTQTLRSSVVVTVIRDRCKEGLQREIQRVRE